MLLGSARALACCFRRPCRKRLWAGEFHGRSLHIRRGAECCTPGACAPQTSRSSLKVTIHIISSFPFRPSLLWAFSRPNLSIFPLFRRLFLLFWPPSLPLCVSLFWSRAFQFESRPRERCGYDLCASK